MTTAPLHSHPGVSQRARSALFVILLLLAALLATPGHAEAVTFSQSGTVEDGSGTPLAGITVQIQHDWGSPPEVYGTTTTDADGNYTVTSSDYPYEDVWVEVIAWDPSETYGGEATPKVLNSTNDSSPVDFVLDTSGTVTHGTVTTVAGPLEGASVGYAGQPVVTTDSGGGYRTPKWDLPTDDWAYLNAYPNDPDVIWGTEYANESSYGATYQVDIHLQTYGSLSGTVQDGSGNPLQGIVVSGSGFSNTTTDASGNYMIEDVTPGSWYTLSFVDLDATYAWEYHDNVYTKADASTITVGDGEAVTIDAALTEYPTFSDVDSSHPFVFNIGWMAITGISTGYDDDTFRPGSEVKRMAMAAFMYRLAGSPSVSGSCTQFSDMSASHDFCTEIAWMAEAGISTGYSDGTFRPGANVSRMAMAAFMNRLAGSPTPNWTECTVFSDVAAEHDFCDQIAWMAEAGISEGYSDGTFRPGAAVSRMAMAAFMNRLADGGHVSS